jgi:transcriptional regulator with XRE-family HTH domain
VAKSSSISVKQPTYPVLLREWRMRAALSQEELAARCGIAYQTIGRIESGRHLPRPSTLRKLASALGVEPSQLFTNPFA